MMNKVLIVAAGISGVAGFAPTGSWAPKSWTPTAEMTQLAAKSNAVPFVDANPLLDGSLPGDAGYDPLMLAKDEETLAFYREAEIKHGRLAMISALNTAPLWEPLKDWFGDSIGSLPINVEALPDAWDAFGWGVLMGAGTMLEATNSKFGREIGSGDLAWDPLNLKPEDPEAFFNIAKQEIKNGRLAMGSFAIFGVQQALEKGPLWFTAAFEAGTYDVSAPW